MKFRLNVVTLCFIGWVGLSFCVQAEETTDQKNPPVSKKQAELHGSVTDNKNKSTGSPIKLKAGAKIYVDNCSICHGDRGDGNTRARGGLRPPPKDFTTIESALELTRERMIKSVAEGRPGTGMMAHADRLTPKQIEEVVDFVRSSFMRTPNPDDAVVKNIVGRKIYTKNCSVCHGDKGNTAVWAQSGLKPPPRDFTAPEARQILSRERMITSVTEGRPGTGMMPFTTKLDEKQIAAVVDYIREAFLKLNGPGVAAALDPSDMKLLPKDRNHARMNQAQMPAMDLRPKPADAHANMNMMAARQAAISQTPQAVAPVPAIVDADMSLPMPGGLSGDFAKGRAFFMGNCFTCHGVTGEGNGPRAHFNIPRPRNFTSEESRRAFNRVRIFNSITKGKVGTVMPAWSRVLTPQQIADVAEFVFQHFIQTDKPKTEKPKKKLS